LINLKLILPGYVKKILKKFLIRSEFLVAHIVFRFFFKLNTECILTCKRSDGGGAQIHGRFSVLAFANYFKIEFRNTPIVNAHFGNARDWDTRDESWDLKWNSLIAFQNLNKKELVGRKIIKSSTTTILWKVILKLILTAKIKEKYIFELESAHGFTDLKPEIIKNTQGIFRNMLVPVPVKSDENIVIHLRRGSDTTANERYEKDETLFTWLLNLLDQYPNDLIRIYTNEFFELPVPFQNLVIVDYQTEPFEAISHMANCKVLVIAKSSMSYVAALMNKGIVYCPYFWHPKMKSWDHISKLESKKYQLN
jgi:hypothetical protein